MPSADDDDLIREGELLATNLAALEAYPTDALEEICKAFADKRETFVKTLLLAELENRSPYKAR